MTSSTITFIKMLFLMTNLCYVTGFVNYFKLGFGLRVGMKIINNINERLNLVLTPKQKNVINHINGFYGLIGPNINMDNDINSLYDLFMGDGIVQGVFFDKGNLTYIKHLIKTEKILYEEKYGKIPTNNNYLMMLFLALNKLKLFPNVLGMANTAILNVKHNINNKDSSNYALFERDQPYLLDIDFQNKDVNTVKKVNINSLSHFSGHSKTNLQGNIETIDYNIINNVVNYIVLDKNFKLLQRIPFKFKYLPVIHDFYSDDDLVILIDSPLFIDLTQDMQNKMPVYLNKDKPTFIYVYDKKNNKMETYVCNDSFYSFHYGSVKNKKDTIEIFISLYDELDFTDVNIHGKYRMIEINKNTKNVSIHKNKELEKYNLDFPMRFNDKIVSRHFENRKITGFVIKKGLKICKTLFFKNKNICGEHNIIYVKNVPYLIFFNVEEDTNKTKRNLLTLINLFNYESIDITIQNDLSIGFHSIFIPKP
jgi:hypothetical protein